jgi:ferredoxin
MAYVVTEACIKCKYTDCVDACPVYAFREAPNMLVIDPEVCIDCDACAPLCPVDAIYGDFEVPPVQQEFIEINERLAVISPPIDYATEPHAEAEKYKNVTDKKHLL